MGSFLLSGQTVSLDCDVSTPFLVRVSAVSKRQVVSKFWRGEYEELAGLGGIVVLDSIVITKEKEGM